MNDGRMSDALKVVVILLSIFGLVAIFNVIKDAIASDVDFSGFIDRFGSGLLLIAIAFVIFAVVKSSKK